MKRIILVAGLAGILSGAAGMAWSADTQRPSGKSEVAFFSGGVGDEDEARLLARQNEFNLKVLFTLNEGNYLAGVDVGVTDASGRKVVQTVAEGPYFMASLPAGQYTVSATHEGKTVTRKIQVGNKGLRSEHFRFPGSVADFPGPRDGPGKQPKVTS
jgi:hypothetical protein